MITKERFDSLIKKNLVSIEGENCFGYMLSKTYENYYSKEAFSSFVTEMKSKPYNTIFSSYNAGKGSELKEQTGRYGTTPPKMASIASSSRFCYLALRDGANGLGSTGDVLFEHECRIQGVPGTAPQLDAFIPSSNTYVEAKCHEIFDRHRIIMKAKYWDHIWGSGNMFGFDLKTNPNCEKFEIPLDAFNITKKNTMFDIKQLLCHLMGIASQKRISEPAKLLYLFFKPHMMLSSEQSEVDDVFNELKNEIISIFGSKPIQTFISQNNMQLEAVAEYAEVMGPLCKHNIIYLYPD